MDLRVNFAGLELEHPLMNAAGTCKTTEHVRTLAESAVSAVMVGSMTYENRGGNRGDVFWPDEIAPLNALGLNNPGSAIYRNELPEMARIAHDHGKPLIVSTAAFSPEEFSILVEIALEGGADAVEVNVACPNVWDGGKQKRIACFDLRLMHEILFERIAVRVGRNHKLGVKPSPFSDPIYLAEFGSMLVGGVVKFLTATNTFPNAFALDENGKPRITPGGGLAGLSGPALKPIALGQIVQYKQVLPADIQIAGAGGIQSGKDMLDYKRVGAAVMQVNTAYSRNEDPKVFGRILSEYIDLCEAHEIA